jgi:hypothetical protein
MKSFITLVLIVAAIDITNGYNIKRKNPVSSLSQDFSASLKLVLKLQTRMMFVTPSSALIQCTVSAPLDIDQRLVWSKKNKNLWSNMVDDGDTKYKFAANSTAVEIIINEIDDNDRDTYKCILESSFNGYVRSKTVTIPSQYVEPGLNYVYPIRWAQTPGFNKQLDVKVTFLSENIVSLRCSINAKNADENVSWAQQINGRWNAILKSKGQKANKSLNQKAQKGKAAAPATTPRFTFTSSITQLEMLIGHFDLSDTSVYRCQLSSPNTILTSKEITVSKPDTFTPPPIDYFVKGGTFMFYTTPDCTGDEETVTYEVGKCRPFGSNLSLRVNEYMIR